MLYLTTYYPKLYNPLQLVLISTVLYMTNNCDSLRKLKMTVHHKFQSFWNYHQTLIKNEIKYTTNNLFSYLLWNSKLTSIRMRSWFLYILESLNSNRERCIYSEHLSHHLWMLDVRRRNEVYILFSSKV